jgi:hypothetical protein
VDDRWVGEGAVLVVGVVVGVACGVQVGVSMLIDEVGVLVVVLTGVWGVVGSRAVGVVFGDSGTKSGWILDCVLWNSLKAEMCFVVAGVA